MITLYDMGPVPKLPGNMGTSPNVRKVIFTLNYKKLPFTLVPLNLEFIEPTAKSLGASPTTTYPDGSPKYTVPFIHDSTTGKAISDSQVITEYLDATYPDTPVVISKETRVLQSVFIETISNKLMGLVPILYTKATSDEMREARKKQKFNPYAHVMDSELTAEQEKEIWENVRKEFEPLESYYTNNQLFIMGDRPVYADLCFAAFGSVVKFACGDESEEWKEMSSWVGGRIGRVVEEVLKYKKV
ncbi:hypothetical protein E1B28_008188 [Marasmius oreades]|uniref:GST N-terminal domain-containing protein n=1 Tax=Marasmius oreades TaxID=181124 RepID=A0A9P7RZD3_9AGAR|nr:uncharacterized protein E1B28_008188 [Marasmius oreades]KAG7091783.1 hypothetical protein E1B28_008188 [Marasmius oreades]